MKLLEHELFIATWGSDVTFQKLSDLVTLIPTGRYIVRTTLGLRQNKRILLLFLGKRQFYILMRIVCQLYCLKADELRSLSCFLLPPPPPSWPRPHSPHSQTMTGKQNVTVTPKLSDLSGYFHHLKGIQIKKAICIDLVTNWWYTACGYSGEILNFSQRNKE